MQQQIPSYGGQATLPQQSPTHIWDYWAVIMKRFLWVAGFLAIALGTAWFVTKKQERLYRATAVIEIVPPTILNQGSSSSSILTPAIVSDDQYLSTQLEKLRLRETIEKAVKERSLADQADFKGKTPNDIVSMVAGNVEYSRRRGQYLVDVSVIGPESRILDEVANALVETFRELQRSESKTLREQRKDELDEKFAQCESKIRLLEYDKRTALEGANFTEVTFDPAFMSTQRSRDRFTAEKDDVHMELLRDQAAYDAFVQARQDPAKGIAALAQHQLVLLNPSLREFTHKIEVLRDEQRLLLENDVGHEHPSFVATEEQIAKVERDRARALEDYVNTFILEFEGQRTRKAALERTIEPLTAEMAGMAKVKNLVDEKQAEIGRQQEDKRAAMRMLETLTAGSFQERDAVRVVSRASEPSIPFRPNQTTNMVIGALFGVIGGIALAFLLDYMDDTIRTKEELAKIADVPLLGIVPNIEARKTEVQKKDLYAYAQPKSTISEAYRGVRTALTLSSQGPQQKTLLLTSAGPREGKTTTAINLATVLAYAGQKTLLLDADLRKPRIHKSFDVPNTKGLTNLIVGDDDPAAYCQPTQVKGVDVLPSGPIPPNPSELLGRPRMREILERLRERYDNVIVDTPPIGAVTDAAVLATMVDGVILVVHAGKTRRQIVARGVEQLRYVNAKIVGVILNNLRLARSRYYPGYYHYYYYYASHYGAEDASRPVKGAKPSPVTPDGGKGDA